MSWFCSKACLVLGLLLLAMPALAQLSLDGLTMTAQGTVGVGYSADFGSNQASDHGLNANASGTLSGYYYNPSFLSFNVAPNYNRSQENSGNGSLTNATTISTNANLFSGSHFPGAVFYSTSFDKSSTFGIPDMPGYATHGNSNAFGIGWSALFHGLPPVSVQYSQSSESTSVFGTSEETHASSRVFNLNSSYRLAGWNLTARFTDVNIHTQVPSFLSTAESTNQESSKSLTFNGNHPIPLDGSVSLGYSHSSYDGEGEGDRSTGSNNSFTASASFFPIKRISNTTQLDYDTSLNGEVQQQLVNAGSVAPPELNLGSGSHSLVFSNLDNIVIYKSLNAGITFLRTQQEAFGQSITANHFSAVLNYRYIKPLWGSVLIYGGIIDQSNESGHQGTGATAGVDFTRWFHGFEVVGSFGYDQDVTTVLATQVTSNYTYNASARRHYGRNLLWNNTYSGYHTGLGQLPGSSGHSDSLGTTISYKGDGGGFAYSKSVGTAMVTQTGLVSVPGTLLPVLTGNQFLLSDGSSYSFTGVMTPSAHSTINVNYSNSTSTTTSPLLFSSNTSKVFTVYTQIQLRAMTLTGGFTRLMQGVSAANPTPYSASSFYIGFQRWFKAF